MADGPSRERPFGLHPAIAVWVLVGMILVVVVGSAWGHAAWIDALPGTGRSYGVALLLVVHLPGLALAAAYLLARRRRADSLPWWWQVGAAAVAAWYFSLLMSTFASPGSPLSPLASQLVTADHEVAVPLARVAAGTALLAAALAVGITRLRRDRRI